MKIFTTQQIKELDAYTIEHEPIESIKLMERAAKACVEYISKLNTRGNFRYSIYEDNTFRIFCGLGNNGGDGLVIARLLKSQGFKVATYIVRYSDKCSEDFLQSLSRVSNKQSHRVYNINNESDFPQIDSNDIIIDCIFGSGLNKPVEGLA